MKKTTTLLSIVVVVMHLAVGVIAHAQQSEKVFRIGFLDSGTASGSAVLLEAFRQELSKLGWVEGKNITIECAVAIGGRRSPTRASLGITSLSISSLFVFSWGPKPEFPVTFPPGRARLATRPPPTGSPAFAITMGMLGLAFFAANAAVFPATTIRSRHPTERARACGSGIGAKIGGNRNST